ncbi:unnamed protein product [Lepeophtheirus salmonis]|uniref:(salmon louse) hypothetical protein n=1 Tax=Lepeophtheirus salmonis TaxID=72036 RepID=A0A7R8H1P9_LEPSM|nr:unnamed protein product [Lepeophtheirus salmonis]CAF2797885.1 unnamed protein product [Lepeophtheirus salmonis]
MNFCLPRESSIALEGFFSGLRFTFRPSLQNPGTSSPEPLKLNVSSFWQGVVSTVRVTTFLINLTTLLAASPSLLVMHGGGACCRLERWLVETTDCKVSHIIVNKLNVYTRREIDTLDGAFVVNACIVFRRCVEAAIHDKVGQVK